MDTQDYNVVGYCCKCGLKRGWYPWDGSANRFGKTVLVMNGVARCPVHHTILRGVSRTREGRAVKVFVASAPIGR
jgi:hypothetical protein